MQDQQCKNTQHTLHSEQTFGARVSFEGSTHRHFSQINYRFFFSTASSVSTLLEIHQLFLLSSSLFSSSLTKSTASPPPPPPRFEYFVDSRSHFCLLRLFRLHFCCWRCKCSFLFLNCELSDVLAKCIWQLKVHHPLHLSLHIDIITNTLSTHSYLIRLYSAVEVLTCYVLLAALYFIWMIIYPPFELNRLWRIRKHTAEMLVLHRNRDGKKAFKAPRITFSHMLMHAPQHWGHCYSPASLINHLNSPQPPL